MAIVFLAKSLFKFPRSKSGKFRADQPARSMNNDGMRRMAEQNCHGTAIKPIHAQNVDPRNDWSRRIRLHHNALGRMAAAGSFQCEPVIFPRVKAQARF